MGAVFRARHLAMDRAVAVKLLKPHLARDRATGARFAARGARHAQGRLAARGQGPRLRRHRRRLLYMVLEYLDGRTVQRELEVDGAVRAGARGAAHRAAGAARARRRAPRRPRPPRPQARQHHVDPARRRSRLRKVLDFGVAKLMEGAGSRRVDGGADPGRHGVRHARVHVARAGDGPGARRPQRPLLARRDAVRDADRAAAVRRRQPMRLLRRSRQDAAADAAPGAPRAGGARRARRGAAALPGQEASATGRRAREALDAQLAALEAAWRSGAGRRRPSSPTIDLPPRGVRRRRRRRADGCAGAAPRADQAVARRATIRRGRRQVPLVDRRAVARLAAVVTPDPRLATRGRSPSRGGRGADAAARRGHRGRVGRRADASMPVAAPPMLPRRRPTARPASPSARDGARSDRAVDSRWPGTSRPPRRRAAARQPR